MSVERLRFGMGENEVSVHGAFIRAETCRDEGAEADSRAT